MRMYPPAPSGVPRKIILSGGDQLDGRWLPQQTSVGIFQWTCNHSALNFHEPDIFHPERWLDKTPPEFANDSREAMQTFSLGSKDCIGKSLAWVEIRTIMARMLWNFDLELEAVSRDWVNQKIYLIWAKHPLMAKLTSLKRM
jgi:cytochrome P450